jgi:hypothetical protein
MELSRSIRANKLLLLAILTEIKCFLEAFTKTHGRYQEYYAKNQAELDQQEKISLIEASSFLRANTLVC